jgi:hypothetical protein
MATLIRMLLSFEWEVALVPVSVLVRVLILVQQRQEEEEEEGASFLSTEQQQSVCQRHHGFSSHKIIAVTLTVQVEATFQATATGILIAESVKVKVIDADVTGRLAAPAMPTFHRRAEA